MTLFVLENTDETHPRKLTTILGVNFIASSWAWVNLPLMAIIGVVIALIFKPVDQTLAQIGVGVIYGVLMMIASFCHGLGHILSSRLVNAPMTTLITTATVYVTHYEDVKEYPSRIHVGRALGGPALNLLVGLASIAVYGVVAKNHFLLFFGIVNLVFAIFTLCPIPSLDGDVILRELRNWKK
jgi:Zn-dependent protease